MIKWCVENEREQRRVCRHSKKVRVDPQHASTPSPTEKITMTLEPACQSMIMAYYYYLTLRLGIWRTPLSHQRSIHLVLVVPLVIGTRHLRTRLAFFFATLHSILGIGNSKIQTACARPLAGGYGWCCRGGTVLATILLVFSTSCHDYLNDNLCNSLPTAKY